MSVETMLESIRIDADKASAQAAENARKQAESHNAKVERYVTQLREVYLKLSESQDEGELESLEEDAAELAEELEVEFVYTRADGDKRVYSPQAFWEPSGGCEWVESAEYGIHYGWNL